MGAAINLATLAYTESDPNSRITISTVTCTGAALARNESAKVYYDWGAGYFGDFVHDFDLTETTLASGSKLILWGLSNTAGSKDQWAAGIYLQIDATNTSSHTFTLGEIGGGTQASGTVTKANFYCRVERNGTTLTFKRATSAANRTAGVWAETVTLTVATTTYQYHYVMSTINEADATAISVATANWKGTKMTSAGTPFDTAYMAGASSGDWNAGATWGNTGSVSGTDFPGAAADVFNIDVGDTVTYNISEANALGTSTVYGTLTFKKDANTKLVFGHNNITFKSGGSLIMGTDANPIDSTHTAEFYLSPTSDNLAYIIFDDDSTVSMVGTDLSAGVQKTYLTADWSSGQTLTVSGDVTAWAAGQTFAIHRFQNAYNTTNMVAEYTIASVAANGPNTDITISEAAPGVTYRAGALVAHLTRNVKMGKASFVTTMGNANTNRPRIYFNYSTNEGVVKATLKHMLFGGAGDIYGSTGKNGTYMENVVYRNGQSFGVYSPIYCTYEKLTVISAALFTLGATGSVFTNLVVMSIPGGMTGGSGVTVNEGYFVNAYANAPNFSGAYFCSFINVDFVDLRYLLGNGFYGGRFINCNFGKYRHHSNSTTFNSYFYTPYSLDSAAFYNCWWPQDLPLPSTYSSVSGVNHTFDDHNGTIGDTLRFTQFYHTRSNGTVVRGGGSDNSIEVFRLNDSAPLSLFQPLFEWVEWDVPASEQTRKIYIRGGNGGAEDWSSYPTSGELFLEAEYYDEAGTTHKTFIKSTAVLTDNTTWTAFPITFTPGRVGPVVYRLRLGLMTGVASVKLYVDPQLNS